MVASPIHRSRSHHPSAARDRVCPRVSDGAALPSTSSLALFFPFCRLGFVRLYRRRILGGVLAVRSLWLFCCRHICPFGRHSERIMFPQRSLDRRVVPLRIATTTIAQNASGSGRSVPHCAVM